MIASTNQTSFVSQRNRNGDIVTSLTQAPGCSRTRSCVGGAQSSNGPDQTGELSSGVLVVYNGQLPRAVAATPRDVRLADQAKSSLKQLFGQSWRAARRNISAGAHRYTG